MRDVVSEDVDAILAAPIPWELLEGKRVLITGASGFLPAYMAKTLVELKQRGGPVCRVVGIVRNRERALQKLTNLGIQNELELIVGDIAQPLPEFAPCDYVIHAASQASPKFYASDPVGTMTANLLGTHQLLELARKWGSRKFLFFSSGEVYGSVSPDLVPTAESSYGYIDILSPRSCYAESKRAAETLIASYVAQFGVPAVIVRPFHTYGPGMDLNDGRVYADFVACIVNQRDIVMKSDGSAIRAFCYLSDATRGFFTVFFKGESGVAYNVGNPSASHSILELAEILLQIRPQAGLRLIRDLSDRKDYLKSPIHINCPDIKAIHSLGWTPLESANSGFTRTLDYYMGS